MFRGPVNCPDIAAGSGTQQQSAASVTCVKAAIAAAAIIRRIRISFFIALFVLSGLTSEVLRRSRVGMKPLFHRVTDRLTGIAGTEANYIRRVHALETCRKLMHRFLDLAKD